MTSAKSKPGFSVLVLAIVLAGCQASPFPPAANPPAQADSPRLAVGDAWVYRHTDGYTKLPRGTFAHTISAIAGDVVTVQVTAENGSIVATDQFTRDWNWLDKPMTNIQRFRYAPPYQAFQFPLKTDSITFKNSPCVNDCPGNPRHRSVLQVPITRTIVPPT